MVPQKRVRVPHGGIIMQEMTIAILLAVAVVVGVVQVASTAIRQRRLTLNRTTAVREAGNVMEELMVQPWNELTAPQAGSWEVSAWCRRELPDPELQVDVVDEADGGKRISLQLDWQAAPTRRSRPVRLVAWRYQAEEALP